MEARAKLLGHPVHQMLVVLPLGLLTGVVIFDLLYLLTGGREWSSISYWLIPVGVVAGLAAAVFGFADWTKIPRSTRAKSIGTRHGLGNVLVVVLFLTSWLFRGDPVAEPGTMAIVLSLAGGALSLLTGWLGGELVSRLGVGVADGAHLDASSSLSGEPASGLPERVRRSPSARR